MRLSSRYRHLIIITTIISFTVALPAAFAQQKANPFILNFEPGEYGLHNQVWQITQTPEGHIAASTGSGIVIYDGEEFRAVAGEPLMVTDLITTNDGRMIYGADNRIGQILQGEDGIPHYSSLTGQIDDEHLNFGTVWNILDTGTDVWIPTRDKLFRYTGEHFEVIPALENTFYKAFQVNEKLYVGELNTGLLKINSSGNLELVPGGEALASDKIPYFMLPYDENRALVGTVRSGLYWYYTNPVNGKSEGTLEPFPNEVNETLKGATVMDGITLQNGNFAIGTSTKGVFILNPEGELVQVINTDTGLQNDVVNNLYEDRQGNLWIALNYGFAMAEVNSLVSYFSDLNGLDGSVIYAKKVNNRIFAATSMGLYKQNGSRFEPVDDITSTTWDLGLYTDPDNPENKKILAANVFGLFLTDGRETEQLTSNYGSSVMQSAYDPNRIYEGTQNGLSYLEKRNGEFIASENYLRFDNPARQLIEDEKGGVWIATQSDGIRYTGYDFDPEKIREYREDDDYFVSHNPTLHLIGDDLFVSTISNFYRYNYEKDTFSEWRSPGLGNHELDGIYRFYHKNGTVWTGASSHRDFIIEYRNFFSESAERIEAPFRRVPFTVTLFMDEFDDGLWFGNAHGLYRYETGFISSETPFPDPQIRNFEIITDTTVSVNPATADNIELEYSNARLRLTSAVPWYDSDRFMEYRYRLEGYDRQWSEWTENHIVEYTALREGTYHFNVQARNREGIVSAASVYSFIVTPPWYRAAWAYGIYGILLLGIIYISSRAVGKYQTRRLEAFNRKLEEKVKARSLEVHRQNRELKQMNDEKDQFMNIATHDLRNPLSGIQGISRILSENTGDLSQNDIRKYGSAINESSNRMFELIDNYLNVHRIEQGQIKAEIEPVSLELLADQAETRFSRRLKEKNMTLEIQKSDVETIALADPSLSAQVLDNLISNAVKYSPHGSNIQVSIQQKNKHGSITVKDQGPGISEEDQKKLFKKFTRLSTKSTGGEISTGLGLSIVKQLVEMMDGKVTCESKPGQGAAFSFTLPLADDET